MLRHDQLFQKTLWFIRPSDIGGLYNEDRHSDDENSRYQRQVFMGFVRMFVQLGWELDWCREAGEEAKQRVVAAQPQFIEVLQALHELDWLRGKELDAACVAKLRDMVFREEDHLPSERDAREGRYRKPASLEEAATLLNSTPAWLLLEDQISERYRRGLDLRQRKAQRRADARLKEEKLEEIRRQ